MEPTAASNPSASSPPSAPVPPDPLLTRIEGLESQLTRAHAALERLERSRQIDAAVRTARPADPAIAAELVEHALAESAGKLDVDAALRQVRQRRPGLFPAPPAATPMSAAAPPPAPDNPLARLAQQAAAGDRKALMTYLRARRGG